MTDGFERSFSLTELLPNQSLARVSKALQQMGLDYFDIIDLENNSLVSNGKSESLDKIALAPELEPIGFLQFEPANRNLAQSGASFIREILQANWRYQMVSSIHLQVTQDDFDALMEKNKQLKISQQRYKALSENLEEQVQAQLKIIEESQRHLYETEKMASIGQLAAGVAHEINNPIGFIKSNIHTASEYLQELVDIINPLMTAIESGKKTDNPNREEIDFLLNDFKELLEESFDGANRVSAIVADLKAFSNVDHSEELYVDLAKNVARVARVFLTSVDKDIQLETIIEPIEKTFCKPGHLNQLLLNLLHNAANAIEVDGKVIMTCKMKNEKILFIVADNGRGMSDETQRKIFEPFYTTHDVGSGTGLGLTVSRDIIKAHDGEITVQSELGTGTSFRVTLPVKKESELK